MKIFNTLTRKKDEFIPITPGEVKIYACGPTVYNYIHIGNARPLCVFDVLRRYLEWRGYKVTFVQNFTDIDDKLIKKANEEGITVPEVAERYIKEFWVDAKGLNVREATVHPRATENIDEIQRIITELVEKGYAYTAGGDVYFRSKKFEGYGKLSHQPLEDLEAGARIATDDIKEDPMDFYNTYERKYSETKEVPQKNLEALNQNKFPCCLSILEFSTQPTEQELKTRYRELVKKYHPDKGGDAEKFEEISKAYNDALKLIKNK